MRLLPLLLALALPAAAPAAPVAEELAAAQALLSAQRHAEARAAFEKLLAHAPDQPDANCSLALYACDDGEWEKALRLAATALAADPANARYQYCWGAANGIAALKAGLFSKLGHARKCLAAYERAAELAPDNPQYHWALLNYYQQAPGLAGGDATKARAQAAELGRLDAEQGRQALTQLYVADKQYDQAFRLYDDALRAAPDDYRALYNFGRLTLTADRRLDEGEAAFRRCLALTPPAGPDQPTPAHLHWRLGNVWEKKNRPDEARTEYRAALAAQPDFAPAKRALEKLAARKT